MQFQTNPPHVHISPRPDEYYFQYQRLPSYLKVSPMPEYSLPTPLHDTDPLSQILTSKRDQLAQRLAMLYEAMQERRSIQSRVLTQITNDSVNCQNELFKISHLYDPKIDSQWKKHKLDLAREERQHVTAYFRDLQMIQKELRDTILEYIEEKQMEDVFK